MKPNELRIGNITDKGTVVTFYEHGIHVGAGKCYRFDKVKPIPLTEEWLCMAGFEESELFKPVRGKCFELVYVRIISDVYGFGVKLKNYPFDRASFAVKNVTSVHQLQNLYFALTDQELVFKEEAK